MIQIMDVRKIFNMDKPSEFVAIDGVSLHIDFGKVTVLKGPSGSGKTTLLSILGCMARPTSGRIMLRDREITSLPERFLTEIRCRTFGFIFQNLNLIKGITAIENVMISAYPSGEKYARLKERAIHLLETFDLVSKAASKVEWLSGGEAQRVTIARALINNPEVVIADEPTAHLDTKLSKELMDIVKKFRDEGKTILIASHDPIVHDAKMVDRVIAMRDGKIVDSVAA
jgi:putative ABC transport system ATP-binding protein